MSRRAQPQARPNVVPWPPLIFAGVAAAAVLLGWIAPTDGAWRNDSAWRAAGGAVLLAGLALDAAAMLVMRRHKANILPHRAATALVTTGPFAASRNPIYLGNTLALAGLAGLFGNLWFLPAAAGGAWLVTLLAIRREEAHLAARFGPDWAAYSSRTPRWLRWSIR